MKFSELTKSDMGVVGVIAAVTLTAGVVASILTHSDSATCVDDRINDIKQLHSAKLEIADANNDYRSLVSAYKLDQLKAEVVREEQRRILTDLRAENASLRIQLSKSNPE